MPIPAIDLSGIVDGQNIDAVDVTVPLNDLQDGINDTLAGNQSFEQANLGASSEVTISGGVISISLTHHRVDTEANAASDDLDTINGGAEGDWLWLRLENAARQVVLKHNTGNIFLSGAADVTIDSANKMIVLYHNGTKWVDNASETVGATDLFGATVQAFSILSLPKSTVKSSGPGTGTNKLFLDVMPGRRSRVVQEIIAQSVTGFGVGTDSAVSASTTANAMQSDAEYIKYGTTNVSGNVAKLTSNTAITRRSHKPVYGIKLRLDSSNADISFYLGLWSVTLIADAPATTVGVGFRFSTTVPDTNWQGITSDGSVAPTVDTGVAVNASTTYDLLLWLDDSNTICYFSVNNGTPVSINTHLPATTTALLMQFAVVTRTGANKFGLFSRMFCEHD